MSKVSIKRTLSSCVICRMAMMNSDVLLFDHDQYQSSGFLAAFWAQSPTKTKRGGDSKVAVPFLNCISLYFKLFLKSSREKSVTNKYPVEVIDSRKDLIYFTLSTVKQTIICQYTICFVCMHRSHGCHGSHGRHGRDWSHRCYRSHGIYRCDWRHGCYRCHGRHGCDGCYW